MYPNHQALHSTWKGTAFPAPEMRKSHELFSIYIVMSCPESRQCLLERVKFSFDVVSLLHKF